MAVFFYNNNQLDISSHDLRKVHQIRYTTSTYLLCNTINIPVLEACFYACGDGVDIVSFNGKKTICDSIWNRLHKNMYKYVCISNGRILATVVIDRKWNGIYLHSCGLFEWRRKIH